MAPRSLAVILNPLLPKTIVQLGTVVLDVHYPWQDFSPKEVSIDEGDIVTTISDRIHDFLQTSQGNRFHLRLTKFLQSHFRADRDAIYRIKASNAKCYRLRNSGFHFGRISKQNDTRIWLEEAIRQDWSAYFVVGMHTVTDADIVVDYTHKSEAQAAGNVPVGAIAGAMAGGGGLGVGANADLSMKVEVSAAYGEKAGFVAPGEQVIAVVYRKLKWKWFASKVLGNAYLEKGNRWKIFSEVPAKSDPEAEDEEFEDSVEVEFDEEIEDTGIEEDHERLTGHDGEEFILFHA